VKVTGREFIWCTRRKNQLQRAVGIQVRADQVTPSHWPKLGDGHGCVKQPSSDTGASYHLNLTYGPSIVWKWSKSFQLQGLCPRLSHGVGGRYRFSLTMPESATDSEDEEWSSSCRKIMLLIICAGFRSKFNSECFWYIGPLHTIFWAMYRQMWTLGHDTHQHSATQSGADRRKICSEAGRFLHKKVRLCILPHFRLYTTTTQERI